MGLILRPHAKFGEDRTIRGRVIAYFRFSNGGRLSSWIWYDVLADHPRLVFDGPNIVLKLHVDRVYTLQDIAIFIIRPVWLKIAYSRPSFWGLLRVRPGREPEKKNTL